MPLLTGKTLKNRYRVIESLGRGGMAEVYKVWDEDRLTNLALKLLRDDLAQDIVFMRRFRREAQNLAQLQHPNIVRFFGLDEDDLQVFILMEFIDGPSLREEIRRAGPKGMSQQRIKSVMADICSALHYAHKKGVVHCDIKSGNVLLDKMAKAYLTDFGIARTMDAATSTLIGVGTPAYMAPELILGKDPTPQSDVYSLGILLFEMLTGGERPFTGEHADTTGTTVEKVRWEHLHMKVPSVSLFNPKTPEGIDKVIAKCLAKESRDRFQGVDVLLDDLNQSENTINISSTSIKDEALGMETSEEVDSATSKQAQDEIENPQRAEENHTGRKEKEPEDIFLQTGKVDTKKKDKQRLSFFKKYFGKILLIALGWGLGHFIWYRIQDNYSSYLVEYYLANLVAWPFFAFLSGLVYASVIKKSFNLQKKNVFQIGFGWALFGLIWAVQDVFLHEYFLIIFSVSVCAIVGGGNTGRIIKKQNSQFTHAEKDFSIIWFNSWLIAIMLRTFISVEDMNAYYVWVAFLGLTSGLIGGILSFLYLEYFPVINHTSKKVRNVGLAISAVVFLLRFFWLSSSYLFNEIEMRAERDVILAQMTANEPLYSYSDYEFPGFAGTVKLQYDYSDQIIRLVNSDEPIYRRLYSVNYSKPNNRTLSIMDVYSRYMGKPKRVLQITKNDGAYGHPVWSPDGKKVAAIEGQDCWTNNIIVFDIQNGLKTTYRVSDAYCNDIDWSPDGKEIAFSSSEGSLMALEVETGRTREIVNAEFIQARQDEYKSVDNIAWSPDGKKLTFLTRISRISVNDARGWQVWVVNRDGSNLIKLDKESDYGHMDVEWSIESSELIIEQFQVLENGEKTNWGVLTVDLRTGKRIELLEDEFVFYRDSSRYPAVNYCTSSGC